MRKREKNVKCGSIFFLFPSVPYRIEGNDNFKYMYTSFISLRANTMLERFDIHARNFAFDDLECTEGFWRENLELPTSLLDLASESVLLYTLTQIANRYLIRENETAQLSTPINLCGSKNMSTTTFGIQPFRSVMSVRPFLTARNTFPSRLNSTLKLDFPNIFLCYVSTMPVC